MNKHWKKMDNEIAALDRDIKLEQYGLSDKNRVDAIKIMIGLRLGRVRK
jgi:hypothetical protein